MTNFCVTFVISDIWLWGITEVQIGSWNIRKCQLGGQ